MTNEELVERVQAGERDTLHVLWTQVERFVGRQAQRRLILSGGLGGVEFGDLYNSGYIAMVTAADTYDPSAGCSFIGWLSLCLKTAFAEAGGYRSRKQALDPLHRAGSLDAPLGNDEEGGTVMDVQEDPFSMQGFQEVEHRLYLEQLHDALETAMKTLPEADRNVLRVRYYQGRTRRKTGPSARQAEERALAYLRRSAAGRRLRQFAQGQTSIFSCGDRGTSKVRPMLPVERVSFEQERLKFQKEAFRGKEPVA